MKKKKIISVIAAVAVVASLAVGSLAYFTSEDSVTNEFTTATTDNSNENSGIDIHEKFDNTKAGNTLPGDKIQKQVNVENTGNYDQLIRTKITKVWKDKNGNIVDSYKITPEKANDDQGNSVTHNVVTYYKSGSKGAPADVQPLDTSLIQLDFGSNLGNDSGKWIKETDANAGADAGYYYYDGVVKAGSTTSNLLENVTLSSQATNIYKNLKFDVIVESNGVQAANGAVDTGWTTAPSTIKALGGTPASK